MSERRLNPVGVPGAGRFEGLNVVWSSPVEAGIADRREATAFDTASTNLRAAVLMDPNGLHPGGS